MTTDFISAAGFLLAVFISGIAVGKFAEKIERFIRKSEDCEHNEKKDNRPLLE